MNKSQLNAIYYNIREKKLAKIENMGLMNEYMKYKGNSKNHKIENFIKKLYKDGIITLDERINF